MKLLVMGCGGIGSWLCRYLAHGIRNSVLNLEVTLADGDTIEAKNLLYSNYDAMDVGKNKAEVLAERYAFKSLPKYIKTSEELKDFDLVIVATDEGKTRKLVYDSGVDYIDLRAKGRGYAVFAKGAKAKEEMLKTLDLKRERESCQFEDRLASGTIDYGNIIAAGIGYQVLLNHLRGELVTKVFRGYV
jgi:saccharopine dehydrogenase-like NADP-dependent oxidoreductase